MKSYVFVFFRDSKQKDGPKIVWATPDMGQSHGWQGPFRGWIVQRDPARIRFKDGTHQKTIVLGGKPRKLEVAVIASLADVPGWQCETHCHGNWEGQCTPPPKR